VPIALPGPDAVPAGPHRDLVVKLHELYGQAGKPATRIISKRINEDRSGQLETVSHETVNSVLRGKSVPSWAKLRSVLMVLGRMSEQPVDEQLQLVEFNTLWVRVGAQSATPASDQDVARPSGRLHVQPLPAVEAPVPSAPPRERPTVAGRLHGRLPGRSPLFTGRERLLDQIADRLARLPETPLILHGPIGAGKTQLAAEYVRQHLHEYAVTWWVPAGDVDAARQSLLELAHGLGAVAPGQRRRPFDELFESLARSGPYLLVFDGVVSGEIRALVHAWGGDVLVTTRNADWAQESPRETMAVPDLDEFESAQLLRKQDPFISQDLTSRLIDVVGRSPLGLVESCRLHRERALAWPELSDRLADPATRTLTGAAGSWPPAIEMVRQIVRDRVADEPGLLPLLTLLLGFGPSPIWAWMLQAGAGGDVSAGVRRVLGDSTAMKRALKLLIRLGLARGPGNGDSIEFPSVIRLVLRELIAASHGEVNRRDVVEILVLADPARPDDRRTGAITPHLQAAGLIDVFRPSAYRAVHHQIRHLFLSGDLKAAWRLGRDAETALLRQSVLAQTDELTLQIRRDLANALRADGRYAEAYRLTEDAMASIVSDPAYSPDHAIALDLARSRAHDIRIAGRYQDAYELDQTTFRRHEAVFAEDDVRRLASRYNLSVSARFVGRFRESAQADRAALDQLRGDRLEDGRRIVRLTNALGEDLYGLGRYEDVVDLLAPMLAAGSGRELSRARRLTGIAFRRLGHLIPAVEQLGACYQQCLDQVGKRRELTMVVGLSYGNVLRELGQFETALHYGRQTAADYAAAMGEGNPLVQVAWVNTAAVHLAQGDASQGHELLDRAHRTLAGQLGDRHPFTVVAEVNRASAVSMSGADPASSGRAYEHAREAFGPEHLDTLIAAAGYAADRVARQEDDGSAPGLDEILAIFRRRFGADHALVRQVATGSRLILDIEPPSA
jgi:tetratricopeptide (TPR) repeat protein